MSFPKISIVTVSFNQGEFIKQNIESVLGQGYPNFEHIVVDGGSTDSTVEILKSYPHLKWTSGPDKGQSDALNTGFKRAQGEYIGWLNSDDWYAPNIFFDVAQALGEHPIVMGAAEQTDKEGRSTELIANTERSYYDLWRYWIPYAWVAQPSIFFRKSLLEEVARPDGTYVDEDLYFTMDSDLWMRMTAKYPLKKRINKTLSYFRIYDQNKTGVRPIATQRECSRIFRRHANRGFPAEQEISFIIPVATPTDALKKTVISLINQTHVNFDIIISDYTADRKAAKQVHEFSLDLSETIGHITTRYIKAARPTELAAWTSGVEKASAPVVSMLVPGDTVSREFSLQISNVFASDVVGLIIPDLGLAQIQQSLYPAPNTLDPAGVFTMPYFTPGLIARRLACLELGTFGNHTNPVIAIKELLLKIIFRGWAVHLGTDMKLTQVQRDLTKQQQFLSSNLAPIIATILKDWKAEIDNDPFTKVRAQIRDPNSVLRILSQHPDQILSGLPPEWKNID
ncbi:MAG: Spore coat polysaccharide biosynthesis protein SpsA [Nitrosomonadaceae bacterium]|nr:Spore coat polysaccharide biosynthesis protein SpsA [Nitrosomonadaceae bacterium]